MSISLRKTLKGEYFLHFEKGLCCDFYVNFSKKNLGGRIFSPLRKEIYVGK